jgi:hypothetical protein
MKKPSQRHFPYQHPTFGTESRPKRPWFWEDTVYFLWWSYLKRSKDYLQVCESGGVGDLAALYADFGDVRGDSFKAWWGSDGRGISLFAEPRANSTLEVITPDQVSELVGDQLLVSIPLNLPKKFLIDRFRKILAEHHEGKVGQQYAKKSKARYKFKGQPNIKGLQVALKVYDYIHEYPDKKLWEVGRILPQFQMELLECEKRGEVPLYDFKRTIESTVSRYHRKAKNSIKNVALGIFP